MGILGANRTEDLLVARNEIVSGLESIILYKGFGPATLEKKSNVDFHFSN